MFFLGTGPGSLGLGSSVKTSTWKLFCGTSMSHLLKSYTKSIGYYLEFYSNIIIIKTENCVREDKLKNV